MFDFVKGLKAREEMMENLRFLFRYEEQLLEEGWYSETEFQQAVVDAFLEAIKAQFKE